jgi:hypothetical protein
MPRAFFLILTFAVFSAIGFYNMVSGWLHTLIQLFHSL